MATNNTDQLIQKFMLEQKKEVGDNFFTESVMRKLPAKQLRHEWIIILLAGIGTIICILIGWNTKIPFITISLPTEIIQHYLLGGILVSPFVLWICFELFRSKRIHLF